MRRERYRVASHGHGHGHAPRHAHRVRPGSFAQMGAPPEHAPIHQPLNVRMEVGLGLLDGQGRCGRAPSRTARSSSSCFSTRKRRFAEPRLASPTARCCSSTSRRTARIRRSGSVGAKPRCTGNEWNSPTIASSRSPICCPEAPRSRESAEIARKLLVSFGELYELVAADPGRGIVEERT